MIPLDALRELETVGRSIKVGLVGAGFMGRGIVEVVESAPAMEVVAVADIEIEKACKCFEGINFSNYNEIKHSGDARDIDFPKERIVTADYRVITELEGLDFIIEATGVPEVGAEVAFFCIMNGKRIGMLNVETDCTAGYWLSEFARKAGVVYTVCTGDEPAAIKELCDFSRTLGFSVVACGKGKNNPLDLAANPDSVSKRAAEKGLNSRILTEFIDGTKTMVELACVANACGLTVDRRNMHGPHAGVDELVRTFCLKEEGGILDREGVVDYVLGDVAPGVFAVVRHPGSMVNATLKYLKLGEGPCYLLYRPYHLTNIEVPVSVAIACLYNRACLQTSAPPTTEVITIAKRDLDSSDYIDSIGGFTVYGGIERSDISSRQNLLPLGIAEGAKLIRDVPKGKPLKFSDVELVDSLLLQIRRLQEKLL